MARSVKSGAAKVGEIDEAQYRSADRGKAVAIPPSSPAERPDARQVVRRPPVRKAPLVNVNVRRGSID